MNTHDLISASLVRRSFWSVERAYEVEWRVVHKVDHDLRCLIILAVFKNMN